MSRSDDLLHFTAKSSLLAPSIVSDTRATPSSISAGVLRLYAPLESWFDKTCKPGDFERVD